MNASNAKDYLPLVQALAEGRVIQERHSMDDHWIDCQSVDFSWHAGDYRIKPEAKEYWVNRYPDGSESEARFDNEMGARLSTSNPKATQVRYREVIE